MNSVSLLALMFVVLAMNCDRTEASKFNHTSYDSPSAILFLDSDKEVTQTIPQRTSSSSPTKVTSTVPFALEDRFVIVGATCPTGYAKIGGWCVEAQSVGPDPDYD